MKSNVLISTLLVFAASASAICAESTFKSLDTSRDGRQTINGLVTPLDQVGKNFYLQNEDGLVEVLLDKDAKIGLLFRENGIKQMFEQRKIVLKSVGKQFSLPKNIYLKVRFKDWKSAQRAIKGGKLRNGMLYATKLQNHLPTESELWFSGRVTEFRKGHITPVKIVKVDDREFQVSTSGHNHAEQIVGLFDSRAIRPFVNQASVYGRLKGNVFHASEVLLRPIPDQTVNDDPKLPRYLFIGDSISGNYGSGLRAALQGKFNLHHPPTNCGPSGKGRGRVNIWLGDFKTKGNHWDIISFNFGHWDAGNTKSKYQDNLEAVIRQLEKTEAKLIWVTTCPVPNGYDAAGDLKPDGKATGRTAGVMSKYLNPWAAEVIARHPQISVCDQWKFVKDHQHTTYKDWWSGKNVHFKGEPANALGRLLAEHVLKVNAK